MPLQKRRVVITGIGMVTPLAADTRTSWQRITRGESGIGPITLFDASALPVRIAGEVPDFEPAAYFDRKEARKTDRFTQLAMAAAEMAVTDAGLDVAALDGDRVGVVLGVGMGGIQTIEDSHRAFLEGGVRKLSPFFIPRLIANMAPAQISMRYGFRGVNFTTTSACASSGHSVGESYRMIRSGVQDIIVTGGSEAAVTPMGVGGFAVMRALSTRNDEPTRASRPFDRNRDGFVIGEGAGILVLESLESAEARGARIYAEVAGYGANADAYHITAPSPEGAGAARCMELALADGEIARDEVDYINAHGTSTPHNDVNETQAIKRVFGEHAHRLAVSSTKSMIGHLLGGAGGVEAGVTALAIAEQVLPPTASYEEPDPDCDLDYVPNQSRSARIRVALSSSFGFGGTNACLALRSIRGS